MATRNGSIDATLPLATTTTSDDSTSKPAVNIPQLGLGTYLSPPERTLASCLSALATGYRHIDTAQYYANEQEVGQAIAQAGIPRQDIFVTTKILKVAASVDDNYAACLESIDKIDKATAGGGYVDLFLIHSPRGGPKKRRDMWLALERLYEQGKARAIGVSNFGIGHIEELRGVGKVWPPHVNQFEVSSKRQIYRVLLHTDPPLSFGVPFRASGGEFMKCITLKQTNKTNIMVRTPHQKATPVVPTERHCQVLPRPQHRRPGILPHRAQPKSRRPCTGGNRQKA